MWFWLAFISALLGAIDVIINKKLLHKVNPVLLTWALFALSLPVNIGLVLKEGIPSINSLFILGVSGSALAFVFSKTIANATLKNNLISKVLPLTAFSGFFTYLLGLIFLSESIRFIPVLGLLSVVAGSYILNSDKAKEDLLMPFKVLMADKASALYLLAILLNSITSIFDKLGLNNTNPSSPVFTLLIENTLMIIPLTFYLIKKEGWVWTVKLQNNFWLLLFNSTLYLATSLLIFSAFTGAPVALVMAIKRLQIFFILILSMVVFKDKPTKHTWLATAIMAFGALLIKVG